MKAIHPTAIVSSKATLAEGVCVGPFSIIDEQTMIGESAQIGTHVRICPFTTIGRGSQVFTGAVLGEIPQDLKFSGEETTAIIGENTIIREYVTVNRGSAATGSTLIGNDCLLMAYVHIAHDCRIGDHVILSNAVNLAGHVQIEDYAGIGGLVPIHQFVRIGRHAFVGGGYRVVQDVPPYILAAGRPLGYKGLNYVGLKRYGLTEETLKEVENAYRLIYRSGLSLSTALKRIEDECAPLDEIRHIRRFIESSQRGIIR